MASINPSSNCILVPFQNKTVLVVLAFPHKLKQILCHTLLNIHIHQYVEAITTCRSARRKTCNSLGDNHEQLLVADLLRALPIRKTNFDCCFLMIRSLIIIIISTSHLLLVQSYRPTTRPLLLFLRRQAASGVHRWRVEKATFDTPRWREAELISSHLPSRVSFLARASSSVH